MAQIIKVRKNEYLGKIIQNQRGVKGTEIYQWIQRGQAVNPHMENPDFIYPGETLLLPDSLNEYISKTEIWKNAMSQIPSSASAQTDETYIYKTKSGDTVSSIAKIAFSSNGGDGRNKPLSTKRATLLHNNPKLQKHLHNPVPGNTMVNLTNSKMADSQMNQWRAMQTELQIELNSADSDLRQALLETDTQAVYQLTDNLTQISSGSHVGVGPDDTVRLQPINSKLKTAKDSVTILNYGACTGSALAGAGAGALSSLNGRLTQVYNDVYKTLGENVLNNPSRHIAKIESFLKSHPKWAQLQTELRKIPDLLMPKSKLKPRFNPNARFPNANFFKNHVIKVNMNPNTVRYTRSTIKMLKNRMIFLSKGAGRLTWGVPIVLGGVTTALAPQELRVKTAFEQGGGVIGGAFGTATGGLAAYGIAFLIGVSVTSGGIVLLGFILGGYVGYKFSKKGERMGGIIYEDYYNKSIVSPNFALYIDQLIKRVQ